MTLEISVQLGSSMRRWVLLKGSTNPFSATGGPVPSVVIPLEARAVERDIDVDILRLAFDLKLGNRVVGKGEIGPYERLRTDSAYLPATATCPQTALPYLLNPEPPQGRITLTLALKGVLRYKHKWQPGTELAQGLGEPDVWHLELIGSNSTTDLDVQVARSDWYEQVVEKLGIGSYLVTPLYFPYEVQPWGPALEHLQKASRAVVAGNPPAVFAACRGAIDALPGAKVNIFDAMPDGKRRDAINALTKEIGQYIHSGRHVVPNSGGEQAGDFPVDQRDAVFVYNTTKLLLSHIANLTLRP
jgi:hypothetical protein